MPRILVTNDDGFESEGLQVLARHLRSLGDVVVVAPDQEFSGAGAAIGALHLVRPAAKRVTIEGIEDAWAINGAPALCVIMASFGLFGPFDLVVSGINPGANTGQAIYHSGTVGAALTARNAGITGIAVSQRSAGVDLVGQADKSITHQVWDSAADIAVAAAAAALAEPGEEPAVVNINVPNVPLAQLAGVHHADALPLPMRFLGGATLADEADPHGYHPITINWVDPPVIDEQSEEAALLRGQVSVTFLSRLHSVEHPALRAQIDAQLGELL